ncbi:MAG: hypothetical protein IKZ51_00400 [Bacteroidales bacterium]|nr:hypothetical protein [Bacteroidales bacterium]
MKKKSIIPVLFASLSLILSLRPSYAQNSPSNLVSSVFEYLETYRVPTGYLLDAAVELADLHKYNGTLSNDNYSDIALFRNALATINSAKVNSTAASLNADNLTDALADTSAVQLGAAVFKYNYIVSNALSSGLINYQNGKVYDVYSNGIWQNPYDEAYTFVFTPSQFYHSGQSVHFKFDASHLYGNVNPISIEFDAGEENNVGYRSIVSPYETTIYYSSPGEKTIKMRVTLSGNITLESHAILNVTSVPAAPSGTYTQPTGSHLFAKFINGELVSARVTYKSSHSEAVVKPFIFVEGFDNGMIGLIESFGNITALGNRLAFKGKGEFDFSWFYDSVLKNDDEIKNNYDVFFVDWFNPYADIRDNAALLVDILDWINGLKQGSADRNIIVGHSMGGLIARYALCSMEQDSPPHPHYTDCYVSFDAPHLGVNVPVGLQFALTDLYYALYGNFVPGVITYHIFDPLLIYLLSCYSCQSAKQMMYYYVPGGSNATYSYHVAWQNELDSIGFPQGDYGHPIENLSIVNGGPSSTNVPLEPDLLDFTLSINNGSSSTWWLQALSMLAARIDNIYLSFLVNRDSGSGNVCVSKAKYRKTWPWAPNGIDVPLFDQDSILVHQSPSGSLGLDYVNSSYLENNMSSINTVSNSDTVRLILTSRIPFVPASSALAVPNYTRDFSNTHPIPLEETPFDSFYIADTASHHSFRKTDYWDWIVTQKETVFIGPEDFALAGDYFCTLPLPPSYSNPVLSCTDTTVTFSNGIINISNPGRVATISLESHNGGAYIYKHKRALLGFPAMSLQANQQNGNHYTVTATCVTTDMEVRNKLDELASTGKIRYIWGYKNPTTNSYTWTDTTSVRSFACVAPDGEKTYVCMKMTNGPGRECTDINVITINRTSEGPLFYEPYEIWSTKHGAMIYYDKLQNTVASANNYFGVWINSDYYPAPLTPDNVQIDLDTIPLAETFQTSIDGQTVTVYCFDIIDSLDLPSPLTTPSSFGPILNLATVRHGNTVIDQLPFWICW